MGSLITKNNDQNEVENPLLDVLDQEEEMEEDKSEFVFKDHQQIEEMQLILKKMQANLQEISNRISKKRGFKQVKLNFFFNCPLCFYFYLFRSNNPKNTKFHLFSPTIYC